MGALALHVAKAARRRHPERAIPDGVSDYFAEMGRIAVDIGQDAKDVVLSGDPDKQPNSARTTTPWTNYTGTCSPSWTAPSLALSVAAAVDVTLLGRFYERFADHAVEIGRRVIFQATGVIAN